MTLHQIPITMTIRESYPLIIENIDDFQTQLNNIELTPGPQGDSAYERAVANGFVGTEAEWLASLEGPQGDPGVGVPTGGTDGQYVRKNSDGSTSWETHAGTRNGHPLATSTESGLQSGPDKAKLNTLVPPERRYVAPSFSDQSVSVTANGWQTTLLAPEITVPALGSPPTGFKWLLDIEGGISIVPPASNATLFSQAHFDRAAPHGAIEGSSAFFASARGVLPVFRYGERPPATDRSFTVNFYFWTVVTGTYTIRPQPYPACRAYLVAV